MVAIVSMEHRATLHYSYLGSFARAFVLSALDEANAAEEVRKRSKDE